MKKILTLYRQHYETVNLAIFALFLAVTCFWGKFIYATLALACLYIIFYDLNKSLKLLAFFSCFTVLYPYDLFNLSVFKLLLCVLVLRCTIAHIINLIKKREEVNFPLLVVLLIFLIYIVMPFHTIKLSTVVIYACITILIYFLVLHKKSIRISEIAEYMCIGLIVSSVFYLFKFISPELNSKIAVYPLSFKKDFIKFSGLMTHPNNFSKQSVIALTFLTISYCIGQMSSFKFYLYFSSISVISLFTISRSFLLLFCLLCVIFLIYKIIKDGKKAIKPVLIFVSIMLVLLIIFIPELKLYLARITEGTNLPKLPSGERLELIYEGKIKYDPGRLGLWQIYLNHWSANPMSILFGYGVAHANVGMMFAHNSFIQFLWEHGLVGYIIIAVVVVVLIKQYRPNNKWFMLFMTLPVLILLSIEINSSETFPILIILSLSLLGNLSTADSQTVDKAPEAISSTKHTLSHKDK